MEWGWAQDTLFEDACQLKGLKKTGTDPNQDCIHYQNSRIVNILSVKDENLISYLKHYLVQKGTSALVDSSNILNLPSLSEFMHRNFFLQAMKA